MDMALILYRKGLRYFLEIWILEGMIFWYGRKKKLNSPLLRFTKIFGLKLVEFYGPFRDKMLIQHGAQLTSQDWVGLYRNPEGIPPKWVVSDGYFKELFNLGPSSLVRDLWALSLSPPSARNTLLSWRWNWMQRVQHHPWLSQDGCRKSG